MLLGCFDFVFFFLANLFYHSMYLSLRSKRFRLKYRERGLSVLTVPRSFLLTRTETLVTQASITVTYLFNISRTINQGL